MEEHESHEKRLNLNSELGMTRRDLLRRGAVVGGTLLWVAPAIQTMAPKAMARVQGPSPGTCTSCFCWNTQNANLTFAAPTVYVTDSQPNIGTFAGPNSPLFSSDNCENYCHRSGLWAGGATATDPDPVNP